MGPRFTWLWAAHGASAAGTWLAFDVFPLIAVLVLGAGPAQVSLLAPSGLALVQPGPTGLLLVLVAQTGLLPVIGGPPLLTPLPLPRDARRSGRRPSARSRAPGAAPRRGERGKRPPRPAGFSGKGLGRSARPLVRPPPGHPAVRRG